MCEQTEINYLDGDIVWVKLGACWWPGQVTGFQNLPEDIQVEFQRKPLIAAVKFFQEDTYEFVKNYQQIYKYNCTLKDEFIKKGLDKYRSKSKDGASYMAKFPGDIEMAEKLTGGDPDILNNDKFSPEEKPDISALFGEKKIVKKRKDRDELRRSDSTDIVRKITHPRFLKESDHEVRIRQQPSSLPSTPNSTSSPQYPCHLCNFTSSRINVIICHIKSHRSGSNSPIVKSKLKTYSQPRNRILDASTPKRKYAKKEKSQLSKSRNEDSIDSGKRKQSKQNDKANKKKKIDPELREKLLADWDDESDDDISFDQSKSLNISSIDDTSTQDEQSMDDNENCSKKQTPVKDTTDFLAETEKLLKETEKLTSIHEVQNSLTTNVSNSKNVEYETSPKDSDLEKDLKLSNVVKSQSTNIIQQEKRHLTLDSDKKYQSSDKDDKKSRLSCFDFDEDDIPEPSILPARKIPRVFGEKNLSLKKEIIKEFEMSQALKTENKDDNDKSFVVTGPDVNVMQNKVSISLKHNISDVQDKKENEKEDITERADILPSKKDEVKLMSSDDKQSKRSVNPCDTELEIVEIFEVEREEIHKDRYVNMSTNCKKPLQSHDTSDKNLNDDNDMSMKTDEVHSKSDTIENKTTQSEKLSMENTIKESNVKTPTKKVDGTLVDKFIVETKDKIISEDVGVLPECGENSDIDHVGRDLISRTDTINTSLGSQMKSLSQDVNKKKRGRPRKNVEIVDSISSNNEKIKITKDNKRGEISLENVMMERKISESNLESTHIGKKQKSFKKHKNLESNVQNAHHETLKSDCSQQEDDQQGSKSSEKPNIKFKQEKKLIGITNNSTKLKIQIEGEELKQSEKLLSVEDIDNKNLKSDIRDKIDESISNKQKLSVEIEEKLVHKKTSDIFHKMSPERINIDDKESDTTAVTDTSKLPRIDTTISITLKEKLESLIAEKEQKEKETVTDKSEPLEVLKSESNDTISESITSKISDKGDTVEQLDVLKVTNIEMLPPKKSQIKKFELSQINFPETDNTSGNNISMEPEFEPEKEVSKSDDIKVTNVKVDANEEFTSAASGNVERTERLLNDVNIGTDSVEKLEDKIRENKPLQQNDAVISKSNEEFEKRTEKVLHNKALMEAKSDNVEEVPKNTVKALNDPQDILQKSSMQTRYKGKFTPDTGIKIKKEKEQFLDEKPVNTFQEAFLKTLQIDKKKNVEEDHVGKGKKGKKSVKKKLDEQSNVSVASVAVQNVKKENVTQNLEISDNISNKQIQENFPEIPVTSNLENIEIVVGKDVEIEKKVDDLVLQNASRLTSSSSSSSLTSSSTTTFSSEMLTSHVHSSLTEENTKTLSSDTQKINESLPIPVFTPTTNPEINMPVKKREMPRIIENVTLTEPMQILKSKLLDKTPQKGIKHKLEHDITKKNDSRSSSKAKVMKLESQSNKGRTSKVAPSHLSLTKKLQVLKAEEAETASAMDIHNDKLNLQTAQSMEATSASEKCIQQSSQTLADMELDINSMPFVLSEDVLTPESIEQMPVVISSIIPASGSIPATIAFTPTTQIISSNQAQLKLINETTPDISPTKKKSGTPAILKNKNKAKPTITSIKTLVPPLTGGIKGLKFQSSSTGKTPSLLTQKGTPGKYVVVQTSGGQQLRYSIQGKSATQQKFAISTGKGTSNAQVVQQGGKVVILTSTQSGQSKMLPLNISKTLGGKVQRIMTSKGQVFCPISPQGIITSKTIIAPKGDTNSPTTSKLSTAHKLISTQVITSKGVLTPIPGAITKTALLGTLSQGILTKGGIYTPISASALSGKTIIGSKTLVTKGTTILSPQNLGTSKAILTPISQALGAKTILSSQNIVTTKGTVLTPITGQQVKAIAAKSPSKGNKAQYQTVQPKVQLPVLQKSQKISMSSIPQVRNSGSSKSSSSLMFQSTTSGQKGTQQSKKIQQKDKTALTSSLEKVIIPRSGGRQKVQQKIMAQKMQESTMSTAQNTHSKSSATIQTNLPVSSKITNQHKYVGGNISSKNATKGYVASKSSQKNLLNIAMNSATTTTINTNISAPLSLPPLEPIEPENKSKVDDTIIETAQKEQQPKVEKLHLERNMDIEKIDETKVVTQPQIMALPTESSDGTQTYVLVTIDEQGQIQPLDNNTLMSLEGTTKNPDGTRTLYIDPSSLGEAGTLDNIVLQFDNGSLSNLQTNTSDSSQTVMSESFPTSEIIQTSNQDILAAALANTDFQQEINLPENPTGNVMTSGLTQTSLINQTILQSTIIPPTEPISSPSVLETSLTLNQPIMTPLEVPSNLPIQSESTATSVVSTIPSSLELPITITNPNISYISAGEAQIQIPGNSMPDIGEIMESPTTTEITRTDIPASTQYLVLPSLDENITVKAQDAQSGATVSYSVPLSCNLVLETTQVQTTPSMPIIDDSYSESVQFTPVQATITTEQSFVDVPVSEMLVSKASIISTENAQVQDISVTSDMLITSHEIPISSQESIASTNETHVINDIQNVPMSLQEVYPSQVVPVTTQENILQQDIIKENITCDAMVHTQNEVTNDKTTTNVELTEPPSVSNSSSMPMIDEDSESKSKVQSIQHVTFEVMDSSDIETITTQEAEAMDKFNRLSFEKDNIKIPLSAVNDTTSNNKEKVICESLQNLPVQSLDKTNAESMEVDKPVESEVYAGSTIKSSQDCRLDETSSQVISDSRHDQSDLELHFGETCTDTNQEIPSQSYEQFDISMANDSRDLPSQSAIKSENSGEPTQSANYEPMETDDETVTVEPPTQSFEHSNRSKASQSFEPSEDTSTNAPTQSFNEIMQSHDERIVTDEIIDDQSFPTQSYEIGKVENISENLETDAEISQEGNIPSQSNDIGTDGIGTSSVSTNNSGLNEDETASSSYVPETPENQERDQDQESAISTSSYEIPPCEELNIASSSVIPDTSVRAEHTSIHDNGVPEIPTSSYNLNPDITSTHVDSVPTSSYDDHVIVEQNVSTSYEVPISMPGLGGTSSQNFVTESTDHRNEPSSYYTHHQEVTASYYESVTQETNSRLEEDPQEEVTPSYYEGNPQVASQSYFTPDEATPSYSSHNVSTDYYDPRPESEASQSYYSTDDLEKTDRSSSQNIEASQSFYQERPDELRLRQQGEATPTYSERYPIDYTLDNSPIERHDLVESSVPATRPTER